MAENLYALGEKPDALKSVHKLGFILISMASVYFARWILLPDYRILSNGAVAVDGGIITSVGDRSSVRRVSGDRLVNLGNTLLLPGFINLHTHLEEAFMRGFTPAPGESFSSHFAKKNTRLKNASESEITLNATLCIREYLSRGVTTLVDSSRRGISAPVLAREPIRSWVVHEAHPEDAGQEECVIETLGARIAEHPQTVGMAVGPHALFSLSPDTHRLVSALAHTNKWPWMMHVAESAEELQAFSEHAGDLYFNITRRKSWAYGNSPLGPMRYALDAGLIPDGGICCQCNYVNGHELAELAAKRVSVATGIRYTDAMGHNRFPLEVALDRGVNLCVVTESVAETGSTDPLDELYWFKSLYPHLSVESMLPWITQNPANALGAGDRLGSIKQGKCADLTGIAYEGDPGAHVLDELLAEDHEMKMVMVGGEELIADF